jgi:hypothetical protein
MRRAMPTLAEIESELPNGFHDAELCGLSIDYQRGAATININVDVSDPDVSSDPEYRPIEVVVQGIAFLAIDAPHSASVARTSRSLSIDGGEGQPSTSPVELPPLPRGTFLWWFFVSELNGFIRLAATNATFRWTDS